MVMTEMQEDVPNLTSTFRASLLISCLLPSHWPSQMTEPIVKEQNSAMAHHDAKQATQPNSG